MKIITEKQANKIAPNCSNVVYYIEKILNYCLKQKQECKFVYNWAGKEYTILTKPEDNINNLLYNMGMLSQFKEKNVIVDSQKRERISVKLEWYIKVIKGEIDYLDTHLFHGLVCNTKTKKKNEDKETIWDQGKESTEFNFDDLIFVLENYSIEFFNTYKSPEFICVEHRLNHWIYQDSQRVENWAKVIKICDKYCQKTFGTKWGKQPQFEFEKPPIPIELTEEDKLLVSEIYKYNPQYLNTIKEKLRKILKGKKVIIGGKYIGIFKNFKAVQVQIGSHQEIDEFDGDVYPAVPDYENHDYSIEVYLTNDIGFNIENFKLDKYRQRIFNNYWLVNNCLIYLNHNLQNAKFE